MELLAPRKSAWARLFDGPAHGAEVQVDDLSVLQAVMVLRRHPVCLICGSPKVVPVFLPRMRALDLDDRVDLRQCHPGCEGGLYLKAGPPSAHELPFDREYDIHGRQLRAV